jgi:aspartate/methionine/tyrosine aminotransferase
LAEPFAEGNGADVIELPPRNLRSDYMNFAKLGAAARFGLASSGVADCAMADLGAGIGDLALHGSNSYGYSPLIEAIADRFAVPKECVVMPGGGASFANHLALAALLSPGDEVLIEAPTYELIVRTLEYLQARVTPLDLHREEGWALDADAVARRLTPDTRLVVLTNLQNPTSALTSLETIAAVAKAAAEVGAMVLIDEVYLELLFKDGAAFTSFRPDGNIVVTSSLTKAYGLSGLRCGWILAPESLAEKMRRLNDLFASLPAHVAEQLAVVAMGRLEPLRARATAILDENRAAYREILGGHPALEQSIFDQGTTVFPRVAGGPGSGDRLFRTLMDRFETSLVPGRFFGRSEHVRIGMGQDPVMTRTGLERVRAALDEL